ncbi:SidA/IucD/PvdA family monooxygenase [Dietzia cercidiphylli]|uniref:SidA/IucD/PvdA family monooxygenase n=1 Tax=Dietzia cercidiphylli TaxID=498199 RepID=UPI003F80D083
MSGKIHDLLGVGIGPFNLGLACLAEPLEIDAVFLDSREGFAWHHGLMFDDATRTRSTAPPHTRADGSRCTLPTTCTGARSCSGWTR